MNTDKLVQFVQKLYAESAQWHLYCVPERTDNALSEARNATNHVGSEYKVAMVTELEVILTLKLKTMGNFN